MIDLLRWLFRREVEQDTDRLHEWTDPFPSTQIVQTPSQPHREPSMTFDPNKTIIAKVKRRIIPNWRSRLSDYSTIALAVSASTIALWSTLPADWLQHLPTAWVAKGTGFVSLLGLAGKFVKQEGKQ